jgi:hypothetical protein
MRAFFTIARCPLSGWKKKKESETFATANLTVGYPGNGGTTIDVRLQKCDSGGFFWRISSCVDERRGVIGLRGHAASYGFGAAAFTSVRRRYTDE